MSNPFKAGTYNGHATYHQGVVDRIHCVRTFDHAQCQEALTLPGLQRTVEDAIHARLRVLDREEARA
jgi:hypothetical protein